jgi:hypothetical protein
MNKPHKRKARALSTCGPSKFDCLGRRIDRNPYEGRRRDSRSIVCGVRKRKNSPFGNRAAAFHSSSHMSGQAGTFAQLPSPRWRDKNEFPALLVALDALPSAALVQSAEAPT